MSNEKSYVIYDTITEQYLARRLEIEGDDPDVIRMIHGISISWVDEVLNDNRCIEFSEEFIDDQNSLAQALIELGITEVDDNLELIELDDDGVNFMGETIRLTDILVEDNIMKKSYEYTLMGGFDVVVNVRRGKIILPFIRNVTVEVI